MYDNAVHLPYPSSAQAVHDNTVHLSYPSLLYYERVAQEVNMEFATWTVDFWDSAAGI